MTEDDYFWLGMGVFFLIYFVYILPKSLEARIDFLYGPFDDDSDS